MDESIMRRLPGLDTLRAIAIAWVMLFHSWTVGGLGRSFSGLQNTGWMGVDLFFVLSGYLIGGQLLRPLRDGMPLDFKAFYLRRGFRILPAYAVVLALYFLLPGFNREGDLSPWWEYLTYTVNLLIHYDVQPGFSHVWSLCVEEHFYLLFPLAAWLLVRCRSRAAVFAVVAGILVGGMILRGILWHHMQDRYLEVIYYPTYNRLDGLLAGVLLATIELYRPDIWRWCNRHANTILLPAGLAILALSMLLFEDRLGLLATVAGYPLLAVAMGLLVAASASNTSLAARVCLPGMQWIAMISYSLYLTHKAVFKWVQSWLPGWFQDERMLTFAIYAVAAVAAGAMLHYAVERPFLALRDRVMRAKPSSVVAGRAACE
jgi:peptidoglycan/LPS O-acetylase OafA/YrhL